MLLFVTVGLENNYCLFWIIASNCKTSGTMSFGHTRPEWRCSAEIHSTSAQTTHRNCQHGGEGVMNWASVAATGPTLATFSHWVDNELCCVLNYSTAKWETRLLRLGWSWVMQQDNDPQNSRKSITEWLKKEIEPSQSPHHSPMKMLWCDLKRTVHK